jgi:hypothetical protein
MRICSALFSPVLVGSHGDCGQAGVEEVPQVKPAVGRLLSGGPPPFWPVLLDRYSMYWVT